MTHMKENTFGTIAIGFFIFIGGVVTGNLTAPAAEGMVTKTSAAIGGKMADLASQSSGNTPANVPNGDAVAFTVNIENIPEAQRAILQTMGLTGNEISVTNTMLACAETSIRSGRMTEIQNGATPSTAEGLKLIGCYE